MVSLLNDLPADLALRVSVAGETLLELDEHGEIRTCAEDVVVQSRMPERIIAAAAGGMDVTNLPPGLEVVLAEDVELLDWGETAVDGQWVKLGLPAGGLERIRAFTPWHLTEALARAGSTWRAVVFVADLVHKQSEHEDDA